jgi:hypothetical protein
MDAELKSFLLQILRNQAQISSQLNRIIANVEVNVSEANSNSRDEMYENIADLNFKLAMQEREVIEDRVYDGIEIQYKIE